MCPFRRLQNFQPPKDDQEFVCVSGVTSGDVVSDKSEIEKAHSCLRLLSTDDIARRRFRSGVLECWKNVSTEDASRSEAQIFSHQHGAGPSN